MGISCHVYIGPYLQLHKQIVQVDVQDIIVEKFDERLMTVPSECFDVSRNLLIPNHSGFGINIDAKHGEPDVYDLEKISIEASKKKFEDKHKDIIEDLKQYYEDVRLKYGAIYYHM